MYRYSLVLIAVASLARLLAVAFIGDSFHFIDEAIYVDAARQLLAGDGFAQDYENVPGYPIALALLGFPFGTNLLVLRCLQTLITASGAFLLVALTARMFGPRPAIFAGLFYTLDPLLVISGGLLYAESMTALLVMALANLAWAYADRPEVRRTALLGVILAVTTLFRPVALVLLPFALAWIAFGNPPVTSGRTLRVFAFCAAFALVLSPWTLRNYQVHGQVTPISYAGTQSAPLAAGQLRERGLIGALLDKALQDPVGLGSHVANRFAGFWSLVPLGMSTDDVDERAKLHDSDDRLPLQPSFPTGLRDRVSALTFGCELFLALVGVVAGLAARPRETLFLLCIIMPFALGYSLFGASVRYRIPILPEVFILSGVGVLSLVDAVGRYLPRIRAK